MTRRQPPSSTQLPAMFDSIAPADKEFLASQSRIQLLKKGQLLWGDGDQVEDLVVVRSGCLGATLRDDADAGAYVAVAAFPPGSIVARSLAIPRPSLMDVRALVGSSAMLVPLFALRPVAQRTPELYENFGDMFVRTLYRQMYFSNRLATAPVERRLARVLWELSRIGRHGKRIIDFKLGQADLAHLVGTDRSELSRRKQLLLKSRMLLQTEEGLELAPSFRLLLAQETGAPGFVLDELR